MTARTKPPFRADHVGSLLRPPEVVRARADRAAGRIDAAGLRKVEDAAIADAVKLQEDLGFEAVTDGEIRRTTFHMDFYQQIGGFGEAAAPTHVAFKTAAGDMDFQVTGVRMTGKLSLDKTIFGDDFTYLKSVAKAVPKITIPSPSILHRRSESLVDSKFYPSTDAFFADLARIYREEIARLAALGCTYLQIDDTSFATLCDAAHRDAMTRAGMDGDRMHEIYIDIFNDCLRDKPASMTVAVHTCRGNHKSAWFASGGYDYIADAMFNRLNVDGFFLEYDDERSGDFAPLRFLPQGKTVVLGIISSKTGALESKDQVKRRIDEATKYAPLDQFCLSPQCGMASTFEGNALTPEQQRAKLKLVVDVAREVWG